MGADRKQTIANTRVLLALVLALLFTGVLAPAASAAPVHLPDGSITGLNHACGAATDSEGDVYLSSAGSSQVRIYDSERNLLGSVSNTNGPCGLAVDSDGTLYVSESTTGEVVRYEPTSYPFAGAPSYGPREVIDASGNAKGISVDPFDDRLYVAEGDHVVTYGPDGTLGIDEVQSVAVGREGGFFRLCFKGECTGPILADATESEVGEALEDLSTIGDDNVSVSIGPAVFRKEFLVEFIGALESADQPTLTGDPSELGGFKELLINTSTQGFNGIIGSSDLTNATGVAAYTYEASADQQDRYLFVADAATDEIKAFGGDDVRTLALRHVNDGSETPDGSFQFGAEGAYLAADPGTCPPADKKACTAGHLFVYDAGHAAVDEFEASGRFLDQTTDPGFQDGGPTAIAVDRSAGPGMGTLWVTAGPVAGAKALAFGPLAAPSRPPPIEPPAHSVEVLNACGAAVDSFGNRYVAADSSIHVYPPIGSEKIATITDPQKPCELEVDEEGRVYALDNPGNSAGSGRVVYFTPSVYPPVKGTTYGPATVIAKPGAPLFPNDEALQWFALNPANGHVFVTQTNRTIELDSVDNGAGMFDANVGPGIGREGLAVDGRTGKLFVVGTGGKTTVRVLDLGDEGDPDDEQVIARITGKGSPTGWVEGGRGVTVDQGTGHLLIFNHGEGVVEEYEPTGAFVALVGEFKAGLVRPSDLAVDNSGGPNDGYLYAVYYGDEAGRAYEGLIAFEALGYGEPPQAKTGLASEVGGGEATLNGTVNPRGFPVQSCEFEYITQAAYEANAQAEDPPFQGAIPADCAESEESLGTGTKPLAVHAELSALDPEGRYYFRLSAANEFGQSEGSAGRFGPPSITPEDPRPISYTEATARAVIDPWGLETEYFAKYGPDESYGQSAKAKLLAPESPAAAVAVHLFGLAEATTYHLRVFAGNEAGEAIPAGPDQVITTLQRRPDESCPNPEYRVGRSADLPDCRAYELITPADILGAIPYAFPTEINSWFADPRGTDAGQSLAYNTNGTLPGFAGNGRVDGYRAQRGAGEHPAAGWSSELFSPSYTQAGGGEPKLKGIAADQHYSVWEVLPQEATAGGLEEGRYLRTPSGFEPLGRGSLGADLDAVARFLARGGDPVVFSSKAHLEEDAAPAGTEAIYAREAGSATAQVVSVKPDGSPFGAGQGASFAGASEDGSAIAFSVGGALYVRRGGQTIQVAAAPNTFAGLSADGARAFYVGANVASQLVPVLAPLRACDVGEGPCAGSEATHEALKITAPGKAARFVNVSEDGSRVYLTSTEVLDGEGGGSAGLNNLYLWEANTGQTRFVGLLDPQDLDIKGFEEAFSNLIRWPAAVGDTGRGVVPTRTTPDGSVLLFQSHASLSGYDAEGSVQIYRYDATAVPGEELLCVSCDPSGAPPGEGAALISYSKSKKLDYATLVPNVTDDGEVVFFESPDRLLPEDANTVQDVYEWRAQGSGWCERASGCLALISSGQADTDSYLYAMSADGHDVFISTQEKLVGQDVPGSSSLYDARVGGGIPDPPPDEDCQGDSCQGAGNPPPPLPGPASSSVGSAQPSSQAKPRRCPKNKRKVKRKGKVRCVKSAAQEKRHQKHRAHRAGRRHSQ